MKVKIWSDVRCPFCYIGKKKFEAALENFPHKDKVRVEWKSFQLDPNLKTDTSITTLEYFTKSKGVSIEQARQMFGGATTMAREVGINFNLEKSIPANSFLAHRLIQMAKSEGLDNEIEEALFKVHFEDAKNIDNAEILVQVATSIGMNAEKVKSMLAGDDFSYEVKQDEMEARNIGVSGVPFFVFNDKYAISGAQHPEVFLQHLQKSYEEFQNQESALKVTPGDACDVNGNCS